MRSSWTSLAFRLNEVLDWRVYLNPCQRGLSTAAQLQLHEWNKFIDADLTQCQAADCRSGPDGVCVCVCACVQDTVDPTYYLTAGKWRRLSGGDWSLITRWCRSQPSAAALGAKANDLQQQRVSWTRSSSDHPAIVALKTVKVIVERLTLWVSYPKMWSDGSSYTTNALNAC